MSACNGCGNAFSCMYPDCAEGREGPTAVADCLREGEGPYNIRPLTADPARVAETPQRSRWRGVARWASAIVLAGAAAAIAYIEGQHQPAPGVGFAVAMALLMGGGALLAGRGR